VIAEIAGSTSRYFGRHQGTDAVDKKQCILQPQRFQELPGHVDDFRHQEKRPFADGFTAELMMLAEAPGLRPFVAEDGEK